MGTGDLVGPRDLGGANYTSGGGRCAFPPPRRFTRRGGWRATASSPSLPDWNRGPHHSPALSASGHSETVGCSYVSTDLPSVCRGVRPRAAHLPRMVLPPRIWLLMEPLPSKSHPARRRRSSRPTPPPSKPTPSLPAP